MFLQGQTSLPFSIYSVITGSYTTKFLQFDWLRAVVFSAKFEIPTCENYKPFAGSNIDK